MCIHAGCHTRKRDIYLLQQPLNSAIVEQLGIVFDLQFRTVTDGCDTQDQIAQGRLHAERS